MGSSWGMAAQRKQSPASYFRPSAKTRAMPRQAPGSGSATRVIAEKMEQTATAVVAAGAAAQATTAASAAPAVAGVAVLKGAGVEMAARAAEDRAESSAADRAVPGSAARGRQRQTAVVAELARPTTTAA